MEKRRVCSAANGMQIIQLFLFQKQYSTWIVTEPVITIRLSRTSLILNRTNVDELLKKGCLGFGLTLQGDPLPSENLYERSDNYSFAAKGVPAVDFRQA
ncbi:MAG: hypothetical protein WDO15_15230 [Bacteroidota bacterium]